MWIEVVWVSATVEIMSRYQGENVEDVEFQILKVDKNYHAVLVEDVRIRMERIRYAQSCEGSVEEERFFPLVRVGAGI